MVKICVAQIIVFIVLADLAATYIQNDTIAGVANQIRSVKTRRQEDKERKKKKGRSTSSSKDRADKSGAGDDSGESLGISSDDSSTSKTSADRKKGPKYKPKSSKERKGWRKWHRKCTPCPEDQVKKWRDPSIKWICGAFQRARRSFKSLCMMHYRNCQDGTMFVKIHDHRCANDSGPTVDHFFYEYNVILTDDSGSASESTAESTQISSS